MQLASSLSHALSRPEGSWRFLDFLPKLCHAWLEPRVHPFSSVRLIRYLPPHRLPDLGEAMQLVLNGVWSQTEVMLCAAADDLSGQWFRPRLVCPVSR